MTHMTRTMAACTALLSALAISCDAKPRPFSLDVNDGTHTGDPVEDEICDPDYELPSYAAPDMSAAGLRAAAGCDEVVDALRRKTQDQMVAWVESYRAVMLARKAMTTAECSGATDGDADGDTDSDIDTDSDMDADSDGAEDYSTTNNQVDGVDEPDFIKNDGNYIYVLADGRFQVLDAWPADAAHRISATPIEGEPKRMLVLGDRAVVYSSLPAVWTGDPAFDAAAANECTWGYDCELMGDGRPLKITVLDISDLTAPTAVREVELSGAFLAGRGVAGTAYTMVVFPQQPASMLLNGMTFFPFELQPYLYACGDEIPFTQCEIQQMFDARIEQNAEHIATFEAELVLPTVTDRRLVDGDWVETTELFSGCEGFFVSEAGDGLNQLSLVAFDPQEQDALRLVSIIDRPGAVYANATSLYVAPRHYATYGEEWYFDDPYETPEATTVHKFALDPTAKTAAYAGSGAVKGRVLNQFSMDERDGFLRIATATGWSGDSGAHGTVSVLAEADGLLETVGQADHIAPQEDIRAVRFAGDRGYVVTYFTVTETDPLFVLDLADPTAPAVLGELEIPGFSTYITPMDDAHLLTIGYDDDWNNVVLQIFDVTDPSAPAQDHVAMIGSVSSSSEAQTNHLAFNYFPSRDLLAIPMTRCEYWEDGDAWGYEMAFSGLSVFEVTAEAGFADLGGVPHAEPTAGTDYWEVCGGWWSNPETAVRRSVFMEDFVFSVAPTRINVASVDDLSDVLVSLDLTAL